MPWFWNQDGKTLEVVTCEAKEHPNCWDGPFATEADAIFDALSEYSETVNLYNLAIEDAQRRHKALT